MTNKPKETKAFPAVITASDPLTGIVEAVVAVFGNLDSGDDVVIPGAFAKTLAEHFNRVRVLDNHNMDSIMRVIGKPLEARELGRTELPIEVLAKAPDATGGLWTKTQYLLDTPEGAGAFKRIASGAVTEYSFAYDAVQVEFVKAADGRTIRKLKEVRLWEYGPVIWGMNSATATVALKTATPYHGDLPLADRERPWDSGEALGRVRALAGVDGDNPDWRLFARAFLWHDEEAPENLTSYKLPYCDVIGGELTAVPRGIFAAAGGRGVLQADIPEADRERVVATINRWYTRMAREFEDDTIASPLLKAIENAPQVKSGRVLSQASADKIRAAIQALSDLLEVAFPPEPETESATEVEDDTKQAASADAADAIVPPDTEAAPSEDTHLDAKRTELEQELKSLALSLSMEV